MKISFEVLGTPAPKGSSRPMIRGGKPVNVPSGSNVNRDKQKSWNTSVRETAIMARDSITVSGVHQDGPLFVGHPLRVTMVFRLRRPVGHFRKPNKKSAGGGLRPDAPQWPIAKPDKDKLFRATADSLTGILFDDDSRIVESHERKVYATAGNEGASITIESLSNDIAWYAGGGQ